MVVTRDRGLKLKNFSDSPENRFPRILRVFSLRKRPIEIFAERMTRTLSHTSYLRACELIFGATTVVSSSEVLKKKYIFIIKKIKEITAG